MEIWFKFPLLTEKKHKWSYLWNISGLNRFGKKWINHPNMNVSSFVQNLLPRFRIVFKTFKGTKQTLKYTLNWIWKRTKTVELYPNICPSPVTFSYCTFNSEYKNLQKCFKIFKQSSRQCTYPLLNFTSEKQYPLLCILLNNNERHHKQPQVHSIHILQVKYHQFFNKKQQ